MSATDVPTPASTPGLNKKVRITADVMKRLPKAELHRHLDGSVRPSTILALAAEQGVDLLPDQPGRVLDLETLKSLVSVDEHCESLVQYLRGFDITLRVLQTAPALVRVMYEVCEDAYQDGVRYLEIRFSPVLHLAHGLSLGGVMEAVCEGLSLARYHFPMTVNIIVCAMRQLSSAQTQDIAEIAWRYRHKGVAGFDLAGPELGFSSKLHRSAFEIVRAKAINCTLHSGEAAGWESIRDSIRYCGANRIGHGVTLIQNLALLEYVVCHRIAIESCPTSNLHTKAIKSLADHPIRKFFEAGALVVPCTDNTTVSNVTLTEEYMMLHERFNFSVEEIVRLLDYGFEAAFMTSTEKRRMRADALHDTLRILSGEGYDTSAILRQDVYYRSIGVNFSELRVPRPIAKNKKEFSIELLRLIPKTDLHCRLDGSVSIQLLWKEVNEAGIDIKKLTGLAMTTEQDLEAYLNSAEANNLSHVAKDITKAALQRPGQLERAVEDVVMQAVEDGVTYMEMVIRPTSHTLEGLSASTVMDIICFKTQQMMRTLPIKVGIVVYVSATVDDPVGFRDMAQLVVEYQSRKDCNVVGFGIYGDLAIPPESFRFFMSTFEYLKAHNVNVSMVAGLQGVDTIMSAIHEGGASRISGAFQVHTFPRLMNYLATYGIPVELSQTPKLMEHTKEARFAGNPIRLLLDNDVPVTICSFRSLFIPSTRVQVLQAVAQECKLTTAELLRLISNGFRYNFQGSASGRALLDNFWSQSKRIMKENNFEDLFDVAFFPE